MKTVAELDKELRIVRADLNAANDEVRDVMHENALLRTENVTLTSQVAALAWQIRIVREALSMDINRNPA